MGQDYVPLPWEGGSQKTSPASLFICLALLCYHPAGMGKKVPLTGFSRPSLSSRIILHSLLPCVFTYVRIHIGQYSSLVHRLELRGQP